MTRAELEHAIRAACDVAETIHLSNLKTRGNTGLCVEAHDLAASKLAAFRDKDRDYVRVLLQEDMVDGDGVRERVGDLPIDGERRRGLLEWLDATLDLLRRK